MLDSTMTGSLAGLRVIDLSRVLAGPYCTQILADHGADVLKIEPPTGDETRHLGPPFVDESAAYYHGLNRNKRAISIDLNQPRGRELLLKLLADADVLIENFVPGTLERWGLDYATVLAARFPRLIFCSITGFGAGGPLGGLPGYDAVLQALCGLMSINGSRDSGPMRIGIPIVDIATGLSSTIGILLALAERQRSGRGQAVDISLFDTALSLLHPHASNWFASGKEPGLTGSAHPNISPYDKYATRSGEVFLGVVNDRQFRRLCARIGRPELADDARFDNNAHRLQHRGELREEIERALADRDGAELCDALMRDGVPAAPVNPVSAVMNHAHTAARSMMVDVDGRRMLGVPMKLARTPGSIRRLPPDFGADTRECLLATGLDAAEIEQLIAQGVVIEKRDRGGSRS